MIDTIHRDGATHVWEHGNFPAMRSMDGNSKTQMVHPLARLIKLITTILDNTIQTHSVIRIRCFTTTITTTAASSTDMILVELFSQRLQCKQELL